MKMSEADFASSSIRRAWEPPEEVVVPAGLAHSPQLQPEDYGVLIRLLLRDPEKSSSIKALSEEFQASGWKMGDSRLRGVMRRLRAAGHVHRGRDGYDSESGRPKWAFAVYRNPQNNPEHRDRSVASPQVSGTRGFSTDRYPASDSDALDSNVYAGQADLLDSDASLSNASAADALDSNVYAGQADLLDSNVQHVAPPTPPRREEEDSSSPNPSAATAGAVVSIDPARISAAAELLAALPGRWACGRRTVRELAPLLAEAADAQGWEMGRALATHLTRRTRRDPMVVLRERLEDLPRYAAIRAAGATAPRQTPLPEAAGPPAPAAAPEETGPAQPVDPVAVGKARELLLSLTGPWELSPESAQRLAPVLAAKAIERGWMFDGELRDKLMQNPGGAHNHELLLETHRIGRLPYRKAAPARPSRPGASPKQDLIDACPRCDAWGQYEIGGRYALCRHDVQPDAAGVPTQAAPPTERPAPSEAPDAQTSNRNLRDLLDSLHQPAL